MTQPKKPPIRILTTRGLHFTAGLSRGDASTVGHHWNAVRRYLERGDETALDAMRDTTVGRGSQRVQLECDPEVIEREALINEVSFESIYDEVV